MKKSTKLVNESLNSFMKEIKEDWMLNRFQREFVQALMDELQELGLTWEEADFAISQIDDTQMDIWAREYTHENVPITQIARELKDVAFGGKEIFEFAKRRGRPRKKAAGIGATDAWGDDDDEFDVELDGPDKVEDVELEDELDLKFYEKLRKTLRNELSSPEFNRGYVAFKIRPTGEKVKGIPMAETKDGFLFKVKGNIRKVKLTDMIIL